MNLSDAWNDAVRQIVGEALASAPRGLDGFQATVTVTSPFTISWQGKTIRPPKLAAYTPTVGDEVAVLLFGADPLVLGKITPAS